MQALIARGVIGDFAPATPDPTSCASASRRCTLRFVDVWDAVEHLRQVLDSRRMAAPPQFNQKQR